MFAWLPVNVLASPSSNWSPWPAWSARVLNDFGVKARDFEIHDQAFDLHEFDDDDDDGLKAQFAPATRPE